MTRFAINPARRETRRTLSSPQNLHAAVLAGFPADRAEPDEGRILWRLDEVGHDPVLYLVSPTEPDLMHLVERIGRTTDTWQTKDYQPFLDKLVDGDRWAFRLRANPVHNVLRPEGGRGRRVGHVTADQQTGWLHQQAERRGFRIVDGSAGAPDLVLRERHTITFNRRGRDVTLSTAVFEGTLTVTDPVALRRALVEGIGSAKGYGCGLLTLATLR